MATKTTRYILASKSPRRKDLLTQAGFTFEIEPAVGEETKEGNTPAEIVMHLAKQKAGEIYDKHQGEDVTVIGADTIVVYDDEILGKPQDQQEAWDMLSMLSDRTHQVLTGVCIMGKEEKVFYEQTDVTFYPITPEDLERYIASGDCYDKAGSYGIQGAFAIHVKEIKGDYFNVVGLPVARLYHELK